MYHPHGCDSIADRVRSNRSWVVLSPAVPEAERHLEPRVGVSADTVKRFCDHGFDVVIESGAGEASGITNAQFEEAGATTASNFAATVDGAEIVLVVSRPQNTDIGALPRGCKLIGMLAPYDEQGYFNELAAAGVDSFAMELMPRISRAQYMDVLSSQANLAGYKSVIDAAASFHRAMPMMMTAAGTIAPAKVLVMGAGVAGLQAVATARRMGAIVSASDRRLRNRSNRSAENSLWSKATRLSRQKPPVATQKR